MSDAANSPGPFDRAFDITVGHEGGFDRTYGDPGNWTGGAVGQGLLVGTAWGVSAATYPTLNIRDLSRDGAKAIYRPDYWDKIHGDDLPEMLAILVFDAAVNNGVQRAIRWLQAAVGVSEDLIIGPATLAAARAASPYAVAAEFQAQRLYFMARLATFPTFGLGWSRRLTAIPYEALGLPVS